MLQKQRKEHHQAVFKFLILKTCTQIYVCSTWKAHIFSQASCKCQAWKRRKHLKATHSKCKSSEQCRIITGDLPSLNSVGLWHTIGPLSNCQPIPNPRRQVSPPSYSVLGYWKERWSLRLFLFIFFLPLKELQTQPLRSYKNEFFQR